VRRTSTIEEAIMLNIKITPEELRSGQMASDHLTAAVKAVREDGFVVLEDVVDLEHIATLRDRMLEDLETILARPDAPFNWNKGNVQQDPPPFPPYIFRDVLVNDMVIAVSRAILGPGAKLTAYTGNTATPHGGQRQPVHPDIGQLWPDLEVATPPFCLVINLPMVDMSPENGSTEIWPGTHLDTSMSAWNADLKVPADQLEARRKRVPPIQPTVKAGSAVIRDIRMWHAGMPNHTDRARPMIGMIQWMGWFEAGKVAFAKEAEPMLRHPDLAIAARWVDGEIDYLHHNQAFDFNHK
jgi:ectoine hydroxylase-related dioxygenase (phytanoyl-CoA dioxygenase family)